MKRILLSLCALFSLTREPAYAQPKGGKKEPPKPSPEEQDAQKLYDEAKSYYNIGNYEKALELFQQAYLKTKRPELLVNIGQCNRFLNNYESAIQNFKAYLREQPDSPYRADLEKLILEMQKTLEDIKKQQEQPPKDLVPVSPETQPTTQETTPKPKTQPASTQPSSGPAPSTQPAITPEKKPLSTAPFFYGGSTAAALGLGAGGLALSLLNDANQKAHINNGETPDITGIQSQIKKAHALETAADLFVGAGAAAIVAGVALKLTQKKQEPQLSISPTLGMAGASISIKF